MAYRESKTFVVRLELEAVIADDYEGDDDGGAWHRRFLDETRPELVAALLRVLTREGATVRPQTRGVSPDDELELAVTVAAR